MNEIIFISELHRLCIMYLLNALTLLSHKLYLYIHKTNQINFRLSNIQYEFFMKFTM